MSPYRLLLALSVTCALPAQTPGVSFERDVKPVLEARCVKCHGPKMQLGKLDLRTREAALAGGAHGPAFVAGDAEQSPLYRHVAGLEKPLMPMDGKLSDAEAGILKDWINQGAPWQGTLVEVTKKKEEAPEDRTIRAEARQFWSFQLPKAQEAPVNGVAEWDAHPVDAFLYRTWKAKGLTPDRKSVV